MIGFTLGRHRIAPDMPCYVIAEIGHNHQGDMGQAIKMIRHAGECGVQAVKFQKRNNQELFTPQFFHSPYRSSASFGPTYGLHREALEFDFDQYRALKDCAESLGLDFLVTPFDNASVDFCEQLGVVAYKVASADLTNIPLIEFIARLGKPLLISTGAATLADVDRAYECLMRFEVDFCFLHAVAMYPTPADKLNLSRISLLKKRYPRIAVGYSCHGKGTLPGVLARSLGAMVLEKHFTLDRQLKGTDHAFSLEPNELRQQVEELRATDLALQARRDNDLQEQEPARIKMAKSIYARTAIPAGTRLTEEHLCLKSPGIGLAPYHFHEVCHKILNRNLEQDEPILWADLAESSSPEQPGQEGFQLELVQAIR
ncbi:N-acetylneuraminate synthase family protein [Oligoflexus tunisiensis]|uniref:N-acetylneuraminate synthase family protein n=1 Tax=Oligoflexus tunisiensis TaxID=708132 RepID=UPI000B0A7039|nr:N-acetylneuraminate synthase family protein [Oligoflexus tunisiensis]